MTEQKIKNPYPAAARCDAEERKQGAVIVQLDSKRSQGSAKRSKPHKPKAEREYQMFFLSEKGGAPAAPPSEEKGGQTGLPPFLCSEK